MASYLVIGFVVGSRAGTPGEVLGLQALSVLLFICDVLLAVVMLL